MIELINAWRDLAKTIRGEATACSTDEAYERMILKAETIELCANDLMQEYLGGK